jgi:hypothetical protein
MHSALAPRRPRRRRGVVWPLLLAGVAAEAPECAQWASTGECAKNPEYMRKQCAKACSENPRDAVEEMEQCAGWAAQGECTRNPKFMMTDCPKSCKEQRLKMHEGMLDERADCLDAASTPAKCASSASLRESCAGTCTTHELCSDEADPPECERALRCRELKDDWPDCVSEASSDPRPASGACCRCDAAPLTVSPARTPWGRSALQASRVTDKGCEATGSAATLLKHCYLSCARVGRASLMRRFRLKYTVRTRRHGLIDEVRSSHPPVISTPSSAHAHLPSIPSPRPDRRGALNAARPDPPSRSHPAVHVHTRPCTPSRAHPRHGLPCTPRHGLPCTPSPRPPVHPLATASCARPHR